MAVTPPRRHVPAAGPLGLAALLAACGDTGTPTPASTPTASPTATPTASATPTPTAPPNTTPTATLATTPTTGEGTPTATPTEAEPTVEAVAAPAPRLSPRELLIRASLDLRGFRPTEAEYAAVEADPAALEGILLGFLDHPRFGDRAAALFAPIFRTQLDFFPVAPADYGIEDGAGFNAAVGDEVLQILARIAREDLAYTEIVVGQWTMANDLLASAWPVEYPAETSGWQVSRYTDERPLAGILSTNSLWWRYPSDGVNYNRGRANAISRMLLCNNYATRPVTFDTTLDLTDTELVENALRTNPSCVNCHSSLDPLGSYLFGFQYAAKGDPNDATWYHPERERMWQSTTGVAPAYYGAPGYTLRDLGHQIAADPRFVSCAVESAWEGLLERPSTFDDTDPMSRHREAFLKGGLTLRALFRSIVADPRYYSAEGSADGLLHKKQVTPDLFASQVEDLTGYRFTVGGSDMMKLDQRGLRSLAGGADGTTGAAPAPAPTATVALSHERVAQAAAWWVAGQDAEAAPGARRVFGTLTFEERPETDRAAMAAQVQALHRRLFGTRVEADGPEVAAALDLWSDLYTSTPDPVSAWAGVLAVLLRDPDFIFY